MSGLFANQQETDLRGWTLVRVAVERGMERAGKWGAGEAGDGLTYKSREAIPVGRRVEVPLGRGNTKASGVVIASGGEELASGFDVWRIKEVLRDTGAGMPADLVDLAKWIAGYYVCPLGMVLGAMLPAAVKHRTGLRRVTLIGRGEANASAEGGSKRVREVLEQVRGMSDGEFPIAPADLMLRLGTATMREINALLRAGELREIDVEEVRQTGGVATQMSIEQADPAGGGDRGRAEGLEESGPTPTAQQRRVVDGVNATLGSFKVHLLRGITGSGKTEVYLRVLERVLGSGQSAMVLVPEISLTPQTAGRFVQRFRSAGVAVLHSGLSASQRHKEWQRLASGEARVVVGARSAVFAPMAKIGVVVVDEEHASDYKQDQLPRYHGRDVAIKRAQMSGCPVLLGSATPSLETWSSALGGKFSLWEMTERVGGGALPRVEVVDLSDERRVMRQQTGHARGARGVDLAGQMRLIGPTLERALRDTLSEGGQALLLLNRRGYACYIACEHAACGFVLGCEHCETRMVQHRVVAGKPPPKGLVRCHHCQAQTLLPEKCPQCEGRLLALGLGTQRVEEELIRTLGRECGGEEESAGWLKRVDGDTMGSAREYFEVLSKFARGEIRVLLGTQMIAKGLDFPNVRLVGVINADTALGLPDFRAAERTFQLVSQVAGRAGRGSLSGRVVVQTMDPEAPAIRFAATHDYVGFASQELEIRREANLPPTTRMARIVLRDEDHAKVVRSAEQLASALSAAIDEVHGGRIGLAGPAPCPIARINGFHRMCIELTSGGRTTIQDVLQRVRGKGMLKSDAHTAVDVDPIALL